MREAATLCSNALALLTTPGILLGTQLAFKLDSKLEALLEYGKHEFI